MYSHKPTLWIIIEPAGSTCRLLFCLITDAGPVSFSCSRHQHAVRTSADPPPFSSLYVPSKIPVRAVTGPDHDAVQRPKGKTLREHEDHRQADRVDQPSSLATLRQRCILRPRTNPDEDSYYGTKGCFRAFLKYGVKKNASPMPYIWCFFLDKTQDTVCA